MPILTPADIQAHPRSIAAAIRLPSGAPAIFRPLEAGDAAILGAYFLGLSKETIGFYGPHPFDQATADKLAASIHYAEAISMIATIDAHGQEQVIGYFIFVLGVSRSERERFGRLGLPLEEGLDCTLAPSLADAYQGRGIGSLLQAHLNEVARRLGFRRMVLMGGVRANNPRAIRFYEKNGFRRVGEFERPQGVWNYDMILELMPGCKTDCQSVLQ